MKAYWGSGGTAPRILVLGIDGSGQLHAPTSLLPGKQTLVPIRQEAGGPQSRSGRGGEEKNSQPPPGIEP
jgi:hypothetical protein